MRKIRSIIALISLTLSGFYGNFAFASVQNFYFKDFTADYYLTKSEDGTSNLHVKETLTAVFPQSNQNHGITRMIPYTNQGGINRTVANQTALNLTVLRNGEPERINKIVEEKGYYTVYIGSASEYVHGEQIYTLEYDYANVIAKFNAKGENISDKKGAAEAFQELYWDTNGTGWDQKFEKVTANLHMPKEIYEKLDSQAWCYTGKYGSTSSTECTITQNNDGFSFATKNLAAGENLTFVTKFQPGTFTVIVEKDYTLILILITEIVLAIILIVWRFSKWLSKAKPKYDIYKRTFVAPQYQPPNNNIHVAEGSQIYLKKSESSYVATLLELAVTKKVTIKKVEDEGHDYDWAVMLKVEPEKLTGPQRQMMNILSGDGKFKKNDEIPIQKHVPTSYLSDCANDYKTDAIEILEKNKYLVKEDKKKKKTNWAALLLCLMVIFAIVFGIEHLDNFIGSYVASAEGLVVGKEVVPFLMPAVLMITTMIVLKIEQQKNKYAHHTEEGLKLARYLEGLELYIKMAEADRLKFLQSVAGADTSNVGIVKLYEKLLPWASLFGAEKSWVKELSKYYEVENIDKTLDSDVLNGIIASDMIRDVDKAVFASTGYSDAGGGGSSFSSGGGDGGFSGGGGGGGGGGGW